ncbi:hypothetical protein GALL_405720 [mine drainage metagenome]|uniref:Uncharacterized protein n=1 Tax=mine drainage metagenome TaxID=410659 RepID=A0A1J5QP47_9ZZZZ
MNNSEMGRVHAWLLRHRIVESRSERRAIGKDEREIAGLLLSADYGVRRQLEEILDGQGLLLVTLTALDAKGIASGATVFMLARKPDSAAQFWGTERLAARMMQSKGINTEGEARTWFTQLWFLLLDLIYTRKNRSPNAMQDWVSTSFAKEVFIDTVKEYLNDRVRKIDPSSLETDRVYRTLMGPKEGGITMACNAFMELMVDAGLIEQIDEGTFRQSLLFAYEMKINFDRQLKALLPAQDPFVAATEVLVERTDEETEVD